MNISQKDKANKISKYLLYVSILLLMLGFGMTWLVYQTIEDLQGDASLINHIGIVRGSIQRAVKLSLGGDREKSRVIIRQIEYRFQSFVSHRSLKIKSDRNSKLNEQIRQLNDNFKLLQNLLNEFDHNPSSEIRSKILTASENCWHEADLAVLSAQVSTENKVMGMKSLYLFLAFNAFNIMIVIWIIFTQVRQKLEYQASFDYLTSLYNRHVFESEIKKEISRSIRYNRKLSLILLDIDHFKKINDNHGHKAGDSVLQEISRIIVANVRKTDYVFRVGGEEFAVIVPEIPIQEAKNLADKIRTAIQSAVFEHVGQVTVSCGVSEFQDDTPETLYKRTDHALYKAKENGRNRVELYGESH